ncbi:MAG TPA: ABC transporter permease [Acidisoma sp.]|uniref:ABC transporter permease n=1 Tax=Acidisoma sp. TaxID=1872115 RepID=UPI002CD843F5|nr:ABC transporter permease [Acidisoma sp.]HTH99492.1 ABC transporter permease [Acidisoma sp.]
MKAFAARLQRNRWTWSFAGAFLVWLITVVSAEGRGAGATLSAALGFAAFYVMAGMGQMLVVAAGPGNIDLSIPAVMTLAGYLAIGAMHGDPSMLWLGIIIVLAVGGLVGLINVALIKIARVPPMVATLSAGFIMQSITIAYSKTTTAKPPAILMQFALGRIVGIPWIAIVLILAAAILGLVMSRSVFGRDLLAVGQSERAAYLAGIPTRRITTIVYVASSLLAAVTGLLLAAYSGGAALDMSSDFLLMSIAVVVIGGTSITGGRVSAAGIWGGSLFLYLISTMLNVLGLGAGVRYALTGAIIIAVLALSEDRASV